VGALERKSTGSANWKSSHHQSFQRLSVGTSVATQSELIGKAVVLTDGKAGAVENVWLDELHGLRISIEGHDGRWPVSTIKLAES
jgi:hypothetical protein